MTGPRGRRCGAALVGVLVVLIGAAPSEAAAPKLKAFTGCSALLTFAQAKASTYGGFVDPRARVMPLSPGTAEDVAGAKTPSAAPTAEETVSGTNNQEQGVDEPDIIKADARRIVTIADGKLLVVDVANNDPQLLGTLAIEGATELLVSGDRALVFGTVYESVPGPGPTVGAPADVASSRYSYSVPKTVLTEVDLSDNAKPVVRRSMTLEGQYVTARLVGHTARVVIASTPQVATPAEAKSAGVRRFVPLTTISSKLTGKQYRRSVVPCSQVRRPVTYAGLGLTSVLSVDLRDGLQNVDRDAVLADADTVYASTTGLYVASHRYQRVLQTVDQVPDDIRTELHRFDTSTEGVARYKGSGSVRGLVLNQFSLSDGAGVLRVATTSEPTWLADGTQNQSESFITTFRVPASGALQQLGQVGGLGKGERIYAVRFLGNVGYVVTFRQVDPLYTVDLSNPAAPRVVGELKIPGYSSYLHPLGDSLLMGVGQNANDQGRTTGTQISLFDVSDPAAPKLRDKAVYPGAYSTAESDHLAFLWWKPRNLAVVPVSGGGSFTAVGLNVVAGGLSEAGRIGASGGAAVLRSVVIGARLYTLSYESLTASSLTTLKPLGSLALPTPAVEPGTVLPVATAAP